MSFQQRKKFTRNLNDETGNKVPLGKLIHTCSTDLVLVLTNRNIPFPNAPVYWKDTKIGMVDEVFGQLNNVYLSVKLDKVFDIKKYKKDEDFFGLENKFIKKERFLSRTDEQKVKEKKDKKEVKDKGKRDYSRNNDRKREFGKRNYDENKRNYDENKRNDRKESRFIENKDGKKERNDFGKKERFDRKNEKFNSQERFDKKGENFDRKNGKFDNNGENSYKKSEKFNSKEKYNRKENNSNKNDLNNKKDKFSKK